MTQSAEPPEPYPGAGRRAIRCLLIGLVLAGVFGMHVLSEHDAGGGHGILMPTTHSESAVGQSAAAAGLSINLHAVITDSAMPAAGQSFTVALPSNPLGDMTMAACILFLVVGASLTLLGLLLGRRPGADTFDAVSSWWWSGSDDRAPPGSGPPRIALCVLRV